jgi:chorismate mutase
VSADQEALKNHRHQIDHVNHELIKLLAKRFETVVELGLIKKDRRLATHDPLREKQMLLRLEADWNDQPISAKVKWEIVAPIFTEIFKSSANAQV